MPSSSWPLWGTLPAFPARNSSWDMLAWERVSTLAVQIYQTGHIPKQGRRDMRAAFVEAAWMAVEHHPHWKDQFERLAMRIGKKKAIVAIARKLLVIIWHVLSKQEADR